MGLDLTYNKTLLKEISKINKENYKNSMEWDYVNYLDTGNLTENKIDKVQRIDLKTDKLPSRAKRIPSVKNILYSTVRPNQRHYGFINKETIPNLLVSTGFVVLEIDEDKANPKYVYYYLIQDSIINMLQNIGETSTSAYPSVKVSDIENIELNLPTLSEQEAIADILSSFDNKIENNNAIIANLEEQAQTIFKSWFVDFEPFQEEEFVDSELGRIPSGWKAVRFDELIDFKNGYSFKSKELNDEQHYPDDLKVFKMGDIKVGGGINPNKTKSWVTREYVRNKKIEDFIAEKGLLLMCMTDMKNNVNLLGHTALINSSDEYIVNQRVGMIKPKLDSGITSSFLYVLTNNEKFLDELRARANSGVQVNLSTKEIKNTQVILPSVNVLNHFNQISESIVKLRYNLEKQNEKLTKIRDTLLPKLMSGEIRVEEAIEVE